MRHSLAPILVALLAFANVPAGGSERDPEAARAAMEAALADLERARQEYEAARQAYEASFAAPETPAAPGDAAPADPAVPAAAAPDEEISPRLSFFRGWEGSVEAGFSGSTGNTEQQNFRVGFDARRATERLDTRASAVYRYSEQDSRTTANRFRLSVNNDWLLPDDSPWRVFARGTFEADEFQDWDMRLSGFLGVGYEFIDDERTTLIGRVGAGGTQQFGGDNESFHPEGLLGLDLVHRLTERQRLTASTEFLPRLDQLSEFRWNSVAAWELLVDPENQLFLKAGVEHRYDSDPGSGFKRSDLDYFLTLGFSF